jgi:hypothetical protein
MKPGRRGLRMVVAASMLFAGICGRSHGGEPEVPHQLTLADLTAYRTALAGRATADDARPSDPPSRASFKDLWARPDAFRGRRVTVHGSVQRIFRQGPVGSFPALAEIWIASPAGDPFCLVVPQNNGSSTSPEVEHSANIRATSKPIPRLGQTVRFTGTFLKMVRYAAGDGARLAPLVVGDRPPVPEEDTSHANPGGSRAASRFQRWAGSPTTWFLGLTLALVTAGGLAWRHLHASFEGPARRAQRDRSSASLAADSPLNFIEPHTKPS